MSMQTWLAQHDWAAPAETRQDYASLRRSRCCSSRLVLVPDAPYMKLIRSTIRQPASEDVQNVWHLHTAPRHVRPRKSGAMQQVTQAASTSVNFKSSDAALGMPTGELQAMLQAC